MEYECGVSEIELHFYENKFETEFIISTLFLSKNYEYQFRLLRRQNKLMALRTPHFVCNNLIKAIYNLSPDDDFDWNMTL